MISITGKLTEGKLTYTPLSSDFNSVYYRLRLLSVGVAVSPRQANFNEVVTITSNFVTSEKYSENRVITYEQPLQMCVLKCSPGTQSAYRFVDEMWHKCNSVSHQLLFSFLNFDEDLLPSDATFKLIFAIREFC